ncbi:hypothetical protein GA0061100_12912 [Rhizobium hainanense]|uniref:Uncharacterized protein n=1 Tax=Rhizobium hainanense TaxID=52131 RepID=A0A1C3WLS0_9HYPH|nr:hypothetical protein GA0061100_12912 [Rhizobium hainanense]
MALEQGVPTGRYSPENPLPKGSSREEVYNGMLPQLKPLTNKLPLVGQKQNAATPDVAITLQSWKPSLTTLTRTPAADGKKRC